MRRGPPEQRFDTRVADYIRGRPGYPDDLVRVVETGLRVHPPASVADIGAGTGLLGAIFARAGFQVTAVEPGEAMARAARATLAGFSGARLVTGRAESTGLAERSVDAVVAGQAFHWFDAIQCAHEWARVLRPGGGVALVWNRRQPTGNPFLEDYEEFLKTWGTDYLDVQKTYEDPLALEVIFGKVPDPVLLSNPRTLDEPGLLALMRSSSYLPGREDPRSRAMMEAGRDMFRAHAKGGRVKLHYLTVVYAGPLRRARERAPQ